MSCKQAKRSDKAATYKGLSFEHYRSTAAEEMPCIRLTAALLRQASDDMHEGDAALLGIKALRCKERPADDAGRRARAKKLTRLVDAIEIAHETVKWANGADALISFATVCKTLEISVACTRRDIAKIFRLETDKHGLLISRWSDPYK